MKSPIIMWPEVVLPGIPGELTLDAQTAAAINHWHEHLGFGTAEVILLPANGASHATLAEVAPLDETTLDIAGSDLAMISEIEPPNPDRRGWTGPMATATVARPKPGSQDIEHLKRQLITHLLASAEDPQEVVDAVIELGVRKAPDWKIVFWAAHTLLEDSADRMATLTQPLDETVMKVAGLLTRSQDIQGDFEALLGGVGDGPLLAAVDGIGACERLAGMGVGVKLSERHRKSLQNLRKTLEDAHARIEKILE